MCRSEKWNAGGDCWADQRPSRRYRARARGARSREMRATLLVKEHKIYLGFLVIS